MQQLHRDQAFTLPIRIMQVGQGNFLRAFFDWQIDVLNERCGLDAVIVIVRPTTRSSAPLLDTQGGVYTTLIRGLDEQGQAIKEYRKIHCVQRELHLLSMYDDYLALAREPLLRFVEFSCQTDSLAARALPSLQGRDKQGRCASALRTH